MKGISKVFDYFKQAFQLNKSNKELYFPQVVLVLTKAAMFIAFGVILYNFAIDAGQVGFDVDSLIEYGKAIAWWALGLVLITAVGGIVVESGLYNMYKAILNKDDLSMTVFTDGVRKYFFKILLTNILLFVFWIVIFLPYVIVGFLTLFAGFFIVPILITIFTTMWKVSIVMDDMNILPALKNSMKFAKGNFKPLGLLVIIKSAFLSTAGGSGGSGDAGSGSWDTGSNTGNMDMSFESFQEGYIQALPFIKATFFVAIPVISIAIVIGALVKMVFEIFFNLSIFVMYNETAWSNVKTLENDKSVLNKLLVKDNHTEVE